MALHQQTTKWLLLIVLHLTISSTVSFITRNDGIWISPTTSVLSFRKRHIHTSPFWITLRGGSTTSHDDEEDEVDSEDKSEEKVEEIEKAEDAGDKSPLDSVISPKPVAVTVKTNLGSVLVDTSFELLVSRSRNVGSIKLSLSRVMPGRPPVLAQRLLLNGKVLEDDLLIDELVDDEDEDDDEEEGLSSLSLTLDIAPPVEPKFATDLDRVIKDMSTSDILDAYAANAAAMYHNSQLLFQQEEPFEQVSMHLRQEAHEIRQQLSKSMPESATQVLESKNGNEKEVALRPRGQRQRTGRGGASINVKRVLQRNLNINWPDTIRNFLLFLFFGVFGGRNTVSKHLLLLGAPLCFFLQARPVKVFLKQIFYCCKNPPSILLSLLPAPQQAILSFDYEQSKVALYGEDDKMVEQEPMEEDDKTVQQEQMEEEDEYDETEDEYDDEY